MKKILSVIMLIALIFAYPSGLDAAKPSGKRHAKTKTAASMTPKKLIELIENRQSTKITDINTLATEIDRAGSITSDGLNKLIASKFPAYANKPLSDKLARARQAIEKYIGSVPDYNQTNAGMAAGAFALCAFSDYSSLAIMGQLLEIMPTLEARQKFLEFGVQLSIFQNNVANLAYYRAALESGPGSYLSLFNATTIDQINISTRKMLQADTKAISSGVSTSQGNPSYTFRKFMDHFSLSSIDPEILNEMKETYPEIYSDYKTVAGNIESDYARLVNAHSEWLDTLPKEKAEAMVNSLDILLQGCLEIES
ncbi:MAG: hypothetical protein HDS53_01100 [Barnesiella sp.]|nr:hypothetical protein [Barnesiella sp.]